MDPADGDLILRYRSGDLAAFDLLVDRYQGRLLQFARATAGETHAEDVVQEVFVRLMRSAPEVGSNGAVGAWLFRVCRNLAYDTMKLEIRERRRRERVARPEASAEETLPAEAAETRARLAEELERLPAKEREVLRLKVQEGLSYKEISEVTGLKTGYIGWLVHQGLNRLTGRLQAAGVI